MRGVTIRLPALPPVPPRGGRYGVSELPSGAVATTATSQSPIPLLSPNLHPRQASAPPSPRAVGVSKSRCAIKSECTIQLLMPDPTFVEV